MRRPPSIGRRVAALLAPLALLAATPALAQPVPRATIQSVATVEPALTGAAVRNLAFGMLTPGLTRSVAPQDAPSCGGCSSGKWIFDHLFTSGQNKFLRVVFTALPAALSGPSGATLPIDWTGGVRLCTLDKQNVEKCTAATPAQGSGHSIGFSSPNENSGQAGATVVLYLGGAVTPSLSQRSGIYSATITVQYGYSTL